MSFATVDELPGQNILKFVQQFEADFAAALQLLRDSGVLLYRAAGNISLRVPGEERIVIAGTSPPRPGVAALVDFDLSRHQGHFGSGLREVAALHVAILRSRPDVNAVIHLHSPYLTGFAVAGRPLPNRYIPLLARSADDLPVAQWGPRYAPEPVLELLREHPQAHGALLANHGPFAWGKSVLEVTNFFIALEESAHVFFVAESLGGVKSLPENAFERVQQGRRKFYAGGED
jgi:L-fuculose-phosphate aldolase/L-ribulose-5-phosphate 4-epimerase